MDQKRIRRLLNAEYKEFVKSTGEKLLVESAFAETTRDGLGLRAVALGLTPKSLIVAADKFTNDEKYWCPKKVDPSIESLQLINIYPLEFVTLSIFRRRRRKALKARLIDGRARYYELGGPGLRRSTIWSRWCSQVRHHLESRCLGSSLSETSAAADSSSFSDNDDDDDDDDGSNIRGASRLTQTSDSIGYDSATGYCKRIKGQLCNKDRRLYFRKKRTWIKKDLYLGKGHEQLTDGCTYTPKSMNVSAISVEQIKNELLRRSSRKHRNPHHNHRHRPSERKDRGCCDKAKCQHDRGCKKFPLQKNADDDDLSSVISARKRDKLSPARQRLSAGATSRVLSNIPDVRNKIQGFKNLRPNESFANSREEYPSVVLDITDPCSSDPASSAIAKSRGLQRTLSSSSLTVKRQDARKSSSKTLKFIHKLSRFGFGVDEKCGTNLCLGPFKTGKSIDLLIDVRKMIESGVAVWEKGRKSRERAKIARKYGISPAPYFLHALGPWTVQPGDCESVQTRRSRSLVGVRRRPADPDLCLTLCKRHLTASSSLSDLTSYSNNSSNGSNGNRAFAASSCSRIILFWTPDYWYRPRIANEAYNEARRHLNELRKYKEELADANRIKSKSKKSFGKRVLKRDSRAIVEAKDAGWDRAEAITTTTTNFTTATDAKANLRNLLRLDYRPTLWDLDSWTLARQLTLIDREIFLRIPERELVCINLRRDSRDTPNLAAWIAFARRISCLIASEILVVKKLDMRTRLVARSLNAAEKCLNMGNFHSARSILAGLQMPAVFRLRATWSHLKTHHSTKNETMRNLCKLFESSSSKRYREAWSKAEKDDPSMPFVGDVLAKLLGLQISTDTSARSKKNKAEFRDASPDAGKNLVDGERAEDFLKEFLSPAAGESKKAKKEDPDDCNYRAWRARLNDTREDARSRTAATIDWLKRRQKAARAYNFRGQSLAWDFLLKARYKEDRDNFVASLQLEPPDMPT